MAAAGARRSHRRPSYNLSEAQSAADSADVQSSTEHRSGQRLPVSAQQTPASPDILKHKQDMSGSISPKPRQQEPDEGSRCNTPQQLELRMPGGVEALMQAAWQVPFPNSSVIGRSPRVPCAADSSNSDGSNTNLRDYGLNGAESPPWSPRRVPPTHMWGEGPPRVPGYRSGGACYPLNSPGVSAANLVEAACELHALLQRRSAAGLGPLVGANGLLPPAADLAINPPYPGKDVVTSSGGAHTAAAEQPRPSHPLPPSHTPLPGPARCHAGEAFPPVAADVAATAAVPGSPKGLKRPAAWHCPFNSELLFGDRIDTGTADEALSSAREPARHQRWASAPPVPEALCCAELADDSSSAGQHAASAPPEERPPRVAAAAGANFGTGAIFGRHARTGAGLPRVPSMPELMGVSPVFADRILPPGQAGTSAQVQEQAAAASLRTGNAAAERGGPRRRTKRRLF